MDNPWLRIPAADYIGHMSSPEVDQLPMLARLLAEALHVYKPADLLLPGCSTGNGLEHIDPAVTRHVIGVDINPRYLRELSGRFPSPGFRLTLRAEDVACCRLDEDSVDLAHCALLFEYIQWESLLPRLGRAIRAGGGLSIVLQCPSEALPAVTPTRFTSLRALDALFRFVDPEALVAKSRDAGLDVRTRRMQPLSSGKAFLVLHFRKDGRGRCG